MRQDHDELESFHKPDKEKPVLRLYNTLPSLATIYLSTEHGGDTYTCTDDFLEVKYVPECFSFLFLIMNVLGDPS